MLKICYIPHGRDYGTFMKIAEFLARKDFSTIFIAKTKFAAKNYTQKNCDYYDISRVINQKSDFSMDDLLKLDLKYGPPGIKAICNSDKYLRFLYREQGQREQLVARAYKFWEIFLTENKIDVFIFGGETSTFIARTAYNVARYASKPTLITEAETGFVYLNLFDMGEKFYWSELIHALAGGTRKLDSAERNLVNEFLKTATSDSIDIAMVSKWHIPHHIFFELRRMLWRVREHFRMLKAGCKMGAATLNFSHRVGIKYILYRFAVRPFFRYRKLLNERYVYFPLFCVDEAMLLVRHHYWSRNLFSLVREVADSLPVGVKLYVKQHPALEGALSWQELKELQSISNVRIIHPLIRGSVLIDKCEAVCVLEGTAGWEAFLKRKPVVTLSDLTYYSLSRLVYKATSPYEISSALFRALQKGSRIYDENYDEWLWFIHCVLSTSFNAANNSFVRDFTPEVCERIANNIAEKVRKIFQ